MTPPSTYDLLQKMTELQVEVAKIHERLEGIPELRKQADAAEDTANEAKALAIQARADFEKYQADRKSDKRWLIGIGLSVAGLTISALALLSPILIRFYFN